MNDSLDDVNEVDIDFLSCALAVAQTVHGDGYSEIIETVAVLYAKRGDSDRAVELADPIPDPYLRDRAIGAIATNSVDAETSDFASDLLDSIEDPSLHELALEQIAIKYAERGDFDRAKAIANDLVNAGTVLGEIALIYANNGLFPEALDLANTIELAVTRATTLGQLASLAAKKERKDEAVALLEEAVAATGEIEFADDHVYGLVGLASVFEELGDKERAFELLVEANARCAEIEDSSAAGISATSVRDEALSQVAGGLSNLQFLEKADLVLEVIEDPFQFSQATLQLALAYQKSEQHEKAAELLDQAVEITSEEQVWSEQAVHTRNNLLAKLAYAYATCDNYEESLKVAQTIDSSSIKVSVLTEIAKKGIPAGLRATQVTELMPDSTAKSSCWLAINEVLVAANETEPAENAIGWSIAEAETIQIPYEKSLAMGEIAVRLMASDQPGRANDLFAKAILSIEEIEGNYQKARALLNLAQKYQSADRKLTDAERDQLQSIVNRLES
jgi:tetratricopeptide (TPR) repeat protein